MGSRKSFSQSWLCNSRPNNPLDGFKIEYVDMMLESPIIDYYSIQYNTIKEQMLYSWTVARNSYVSLES